MPPPALRRTESAHGDGIPIPGDGLSLSAGGAAAPRAPPSSGAQPAAAVPATVPAVAAPGAVAQRSAPPSQFDWHTFLTIEERQTIRMKVRGAYANSCRTYEELLEVCVLLALRKRGVRGARKGTWALVALARR